MTDWLVVAGALLVVGPVIGLFGFFDVGMWRVWTVPRVEHLSIVNVHRRGWSAVNAGFFTATVVTAAGLIALAATMDVADGPRVALVVATALYAAGGLLWCAVQAIRNRTTPALAVLVAAGTPTEVVETLLGAAIGGLFAAFALATGMALVILGLVLVAVGGIPAPISWFTVAVGFVAAGVIVGGRDLIPAILYLPTLFLGIALVQGWS